MSKFLSAMQPYFAHPTELVFSRKASFFCSNASIVKIIELDKITGKNEYFPHQDYSVDNYDAHPQTSHSDAGHCPHHYHQQHQHHEKSAD